MVCVKCGQEAGDGLTWCWTCYCKHNKLGLYQNFEEKTFKLLEDEANNEYYEDEHETVQIL